MSYFIHLFVLLWFVSDSNVVLRFGGVRCGNGSCVIAINLFGLVFNAVGQLFEL